MISFFESQNHSIFAVQTNQTISKNEIKKLEWLLGNATLLSESQINKEFIGPRAAMISPWSTNAVEICKNMGLDSVLRIEKYLESIKSTNNFDPMFNTNNSSKNFITVRTTNVFNENNIDKRIFTFARNADVKNRKNKGLVNKVNFELDDAIAWRIPPVIE